MWDLFSDLENNALIFERYEHSTYQCFSIEYSENGGLWYYGYECPLKNWHNNIEFTGHVNDSKVVESVYVLILLMMHY